MPAFLYYHLYSFIYKNSNTTRTTDATTITSMPSAVYGTSLHTVNTSIVLPTSITTLLSTAIMLANALP